MKTSPPSRSSGTSSALIPAKPTPTLSNGVNIRFVDQNGHRYPTVGDWFFDDEGVLTIPATRYEDLRMSLAVAFHEFIEATLCITEGISPEQVDAFDMGQGMDYDEPGRHPSAPYHRQHMFALAMERKYTQALGLDWEAYNKLVQDKPNEK
jgi:hypothetical protein